MNNRNLRDLGSQTARNGFRNEDTVVSKFNDWQEDEDAKKWLRIMGYDLNEIEYVNAVKISGEKTDIQVQITIKLKDVIERENLQVKLVSIKNGFNQVDKRWVNNYTDLWNIPSNVTELLKRFAGELSPNIPNPRDSRRMFVDEFSERDRNRLLQYFRDNKTLIVNDILKGRGSLSAEWMLVAQKIANNARWILKPMNIVVNYFGNGEVVVSPRGSIYIGRITVQRKGGDAGRPTANMLQFKIDPTGLFQI
jgi:hypothetical protein